MKINTKVVFEWNPKSKQYEEVYCDSYEHYGEVAECQYQSGGQPSWLRNIFGPKKLGLGPGGSYTTAFSQSGPFYGNRRGFDMGDIFGPQSIFNYGRGAAGGADVNPTYDVNYTSEADLDQQWGEDFSWRSSKAAPKVATDVAGKGGLSSLWKGMSSTTKAMGGGALLGGLVGYGQAKSQKKGLGVAIKELDPLKDKYLGEHERQLGLAESYRPGGKYSRYMGGQIMSQAAESAGQESQRMVASGITSPSMMRAMARQSRSQAQYALPGMELQLSQMALPYEQMGAQSLQQYGGVVEQLASLRGAKAAVNPWASALSGGMQGMMGAASMAASFMSDRRMKKDIKYLHKSNEGHKVYSFKYKDGDTKYSGVMAQDVLKINPNAVTLKNGMLAVYYDMIDVDMQRLDTI